MPKQTDQLCEQLLPILRKYHIQKAILFGSWARGEATRRSDVDLILVQNTEKRFLERYDGIFYEMNKVIADRVVELLIYTPDELAAISHRPFIARALKEGKVIYESK
ncbi:MAG: nucleotidyltransferase domain-containing protein [Chloroflexi bacterium]|nr:nucleotidyltransferase domain-containing protein [Chloroflexota bacterium]